MKSLMKYINWRRWTSILVMVCFPMTGLNIPLAQAQDYHLPVPGVIVHLSPPLDPPILKGIKVHPDNPFRFDFILDKGDSELSNDQLKDESSTLIKYFLASLTIPEKDLWVNLSPDEKDRIIPNSFGLTEMGRDLLAEDYMLKQITASLIYPEEEIGKKFWKRIYEEAQKRYGTTDVPVNTFNKVWIVPEKAVVYENAKAGTAYVVKSKLKVMLEQDYLSLEKHEGIQSGKAQTKDTNQLGSQIVREIVIPELTTEVNENKNFAKLRQIYNSLILATWYKKKIKDSILSQVYADKNKVAGVNIDDPQEKEKIYQRYLRAFKKGVYNYIKEDIDPVTQETIPRKYFSGGMNFAMNAVGAIGIGKEIETTSELPTGEDEKPLYVVEDNMQGVEPKGRDLNQSLKFGNDLGHLPSPKGIGDLLPWPGLGDSPEDKFRKKHDIPPWIGVIEVSQGVFVVDPADKGELREWRYRQEHGLPFWVELRQINERGDLGIASGQEDALREWRYRQKHALPFWVDLQRINEWGDLGIAPGQEDALASRYRQKHNIPEWVPLRPLGNGNFTVDENWLEQAKINMKLNSASPEALEAERSYNHDSLMAKYNNGTAVSYKYFDRWLGISESDPAYEKAIKQAISGLVIESKSYLTRFPNDTHAVIYRCTLNGGRVSVITISKNGKMIKMFVRVLRYGEIDIEKGKEYYEVPQQALDAMLPILEQYSGKQLDISDGFKLALPWLLTDSDRKVFEDALKANPLLEEFFFSLLNRTQDLLFSGKVVISSKKIFGAIHPKHYIGRFSYSPDAINEFMHEFIHEVFDVLTPEQRDIIDQYVRQHHPEIFDLDKTSVYRGMIQNTYPTEWLAFYLAMALRGVNTEQFRNEHGEIVTTLTLKAEDVDFIYELGLINAELRDQIRQRLEERKRVKQEEKILGAMHDGSKAAVRLDALRRLLKMKGIDIEEWAESQAQKMGNLSQRKLREALVFVGLTPQQIDYLIDKIILVDVPSQIRLEGESSRIGGVIIKTRNGYKILFPKERILANLQNKEFLADLLHEVVEIQAIERGVPVAQAHEIAMQARAEFLGKHGQVGEEFDRHFKEEIEEEQRFTGFSGMNGEQVIKGMAIKKVTLVEDGVFGGRVFEVVSQAGDKFIVLVDELNHVVAIALSTKGVNSFLIIPSAKQELLGEQFLILLRKYNPFFEEKLQPFLKANNFEDNRLQAGQKNKVKIFLPLINPYYQTPQFRNDFINNPIIRNFANRLSPEIIYKFSHEIRQALHNGEHGNSMGEQTWYDIHTHRTMESFPLYHQSVVAHELAHEWFDELSSEQRQELSDYFLNRLEMVSVITTDQMYSQLKGDHLVTEIISQIIGALVQGFTSVNMQDNRGFTVRDSIRNEDIEILIRLGFLPEEFRDINHTAQESQAISIEDLVRVYPQVQEKVRGKAHQNKIVGAMHEGRKAEDRTTPQINGGGDKAMAESAQATMVLEADLPTDPQIAEAGIEDFSKMVASLHPSLAKYVLEDSDLINALVSVYTGVNPEQSISLPDVFLPFERKIFLDAIQADGNIKVVGGNELLNLRAAQRVMRANRGVLFEGKPIFPSDDPQWLLENIKEWMGSNDKGIKVVRYGLLSGFPRAAVMKYVTWSRAIEKMGGVNSMDPLIQEELFPRFSFMTKSAEQKDRLKKQIAEKYPFLTDEELNVLVDRRQEKTPGGGFAGFSNEDYQWGIQLFKIINIATSKVDPQLAKDIEKYQDEQPSEFTNPDGSRKSPIKAIITRLTEALIIYLNHKVKSYVKVFTKRSPVNGSEGQRYSAMNTRTSQGELARNTVESRKGGIDLTPANMNLQTQNGGSEIKFHLNPAMLAQLQKASGFTPKVINILPMTDLKSFLMFGVIKNSQPNT